MEGIGYVLQGSGVRVRVLPDHSIFMITVSGVVSVMSANTLIFSTSKSDPLENIS